MPLIPLVVYDVSRHTRSSNPEDDEIQLLKVFSTSSPPIENSELTRKDYVDGEVSKALRVNNRSCEASVSVLDAVYLDTDGILKRANASSISTARVKGFVTEKSSSTICNFIRWGVLDGFTGLDITKNYYLDSNDGGITSSVPTIPGYVRIKVGEPLSSTELLIDISTTTVRS